MANGVKTSGGAKILIAKEGRGFEMLYDLCARIFLKAVCGMSATTQQNNGDGASRLQNDGFRWYEL